MRIRVHRSDGGTGTYSQTDSRRANMLARRLDPAHMFTSGPIVIGVLNPFTLLRTDDVCWVAADRHPGLKASYPRGIEQIRRLPRREDYEHILNRQWPKWRARARSAPGELLEAIAELRFRGGATEFLHLVGRVTKSALIEQVFGAPTICATFPTDGVLYVNPGAITRARIYHSAQDVPLPDGVWMAEADEV